MKTKNQVKKFQNQGAFLKILRCTNLQSQIGFARICDFKNGQYFSNCERGISSMPFHAWINIHNRFPFDWNLLKEAMIKDQASWIDSHYYLTNEYLNDSVVSQSIPV